jgi:hypothetical protein
MDKEVLKSTRFYENSIIKTIRLAHFPELEENLEI